MKQTRLIPFDIEKAKQGAKVVTRCGTPIRLGFYDIKDDNYPILGVVEVEGEHEFTTCFTKEGKYVKGKDESPFDLFIEEEVEETDNKLEIRPDKWYVCDSTTCSSEPEIGKRAWFYKGTSYLGTDLLKLDLDFASENYGDYFRPWTIQDAKPGDILASKDGLDVLIFKDKDNRNGFSSYYNIRRRGELRWSNYDFIPATQEQRDLLFQKMKESGYEWNSDKKELQRYMTYYEVAMWLTEKPHRQYKLDGSSWIYSCLSYYEEDGNDVADNFLIRENGGEWHRPMIAKK